MLLCQSQFDQFRKRSSRFRFLPAASLSMVDRLPDRGSPNRIRPPTDCGMFFRLCHMDADADARRRRWRTRRATRRRSGEHYDKVNRSACHLCVKIRAYLVREAGASVGCPHVGSTRGIAMPLPVPGSFPVMSIFPGFLGPKIRGYLYDDVRSRCAQVFDLGPLSAAGSALSRTDPFFRGNCAVKPGIC